MQGGSFSSFCASSTSSEVLQEEPQCLGTQLEEMISRMKEETMSRISLLESLIKQGKQKSAQLAPSSDEWIIDTGATHRHSGMRQKIVNFRSCEEPNFMTIANGTSVPITGTLARFHLLKVEMASDIQTENQIGSHLLKVFGYSLMKGIGIGKYISSDVFTVGGYDWIINYYPDGHNDQAKDFISLYLELKSAAESVHTIFSFDILQQDGVPLYSTKTPYSVITVFRNTTAAMCQSFGYDYIAKKEEFEASECLKDDAFIVYCNVTVLKRTILRAHNSFGVIVPPSTLNQNLVNLLESGKGTDVRFLVKGEEFHAHRCVLAARSTVFNAMFFYYMEEKRTDTIMIDDIEAQVFKSMLHFIYSDSLFGLEGKQNLRLMAEHLLVAADRYALERLRLMCEDVLSKHLGVSNVATTIILAERHNCNQLKAQCLKFMSHPEVLVKMELTPGFENLIKICPSVLKDIKALKLNGDHS